MKKDLLHRAIIDFAGTALVLCPLLFFCFKTGGM